MSFKTSKICKQCGELFTRYTSAFRKRGFSFCSVKCARAHQIGRPNPCKPRNLTKKHCESCGREYMPRQNPSRFCNRACMNVGMRGENSANWKGGRTIDSNGYVWIRLPDHPRAKGYGYVKEHTVVMERQIGRFLTNDESVHHINGDRADNRAENLQLRGKRQHGKGAAYVCGDCGSLNVIAVPISTVA